MEQPLKDCLLLCKVRGSSCELMYTLLTKMTGRLPSTSESDTLRTGPSGPSVSDADFLPGDGSAGGAPSGPALTLTTGGVPGSPTPTQTAGSALRMS